MCCHRRASLWTLHAFLTFTSPSTGRGGSRLDILSVLEWAGGNKSEAARVLGIERKTLSRKLKKGDLPEESEGDDS